MTIRLRAKLLRHLIPFLIVAMMICFGGVLSIVLDELLFSVAPWTVR